MSVTHALSACCWLLHHNGLQNVAKLHCHSFDRAVVVPTELRQGCLTNQILIPANVTDDNRFGPTI
jgi:sirohydrochlorin ferrochelatase